MKKKQKKGLHPKFPVVSGIYQMTANWAIALPVELNRRIEDDALVLWRPGLTAWVIVWNNDHDESAEKRMTQLRRDVSAQAYDLVEEADGELLRLGYRLDEESDDGRVAGLNTFVVGVSGHVQMSVYFDDEADEPHALAMFRGISETSK